jgi:hypothetical protein
MINSRLPARLAPGREVVGVYILSASVFFVWVGVYIKVTSVFFDFAPSTQR